MIYILDKCNRCLDKDSCIYKNTYQEYYESVKEYSDDLNPAPELFKLFPIIDCERYQANTSNWMDYYKQIKTSDDNKKGLG